MVHMVLRWALLSFCVVSPSGCFLRSVVDVRVTTIPSGEAGALQSLVLPSAPSGCNNAFYGLEGFGGGLRCDLDGDDDVDRDDLPRHAS
jgi:hypothetical protein